MRRFNDLQEDATGVLGMGELDTRSTRTDLRGVVEKPDSARTQDLTDTVDIGNTVRNLLDPAAPTIVRNEFSDRGLGGQGGEQLYDRGTFAVEPRTEHGLLDTLLLIGLAVQDTETKDLGVERDGVIEIQDGVADMVDTSKQI